MQGERVVFTEENNPQTYVKLIASGEVDDTLLEALEDYVKRQRKRLGQRKKLVGWVERQRNPSSAGSMGFAFGSTHPTGCTTTEMAFSITTSKPATLKSKTGH